MKYSATLNGKQYEVELERVDEYAPIPRGGVAAAAPTAPITAPAVKAAPAATSATASKTGDTNLTALWITLSAVSAGIVTAMVVAIKKRRVE